jgi:hypothetical protein
MSGQHTLARKKKKKLKFCPGLGNSLGSNPDMFQKYKMGDIRKVAANTL